MLFPMRDYNGGDIFEACLHFFISWYQYWESIDEYRYSGCQYCYQERKSDDMPSLTQRGSKPPALQTGALLKLLLPWQLSDAIFWHDNVAERPLPDFVRFGAGDNLFLPFVGLACGAGRGKHRETPLSSIISKENFSIRNTKTSEVGERELRSISCLNVFWEIIWIYSSW